MFGLIAPVISCASVETPQLLNRNVLDGGEKELLLLYQTKGPRQVLS